MDEKNTKCVMIIDESLPLGLMANSASVMGATLGKKMPDIIGCDVKDKMGFIHEGIIKIPIPILKSNALNIKKLRETLYQKEYENIFVIDFSDVAQSCKDYGEYIAKFALEENYNYFGITIFGDKKTVNKLTGSMPLLK